MDRSEGLCMHLCFGMLSGIARWPSRGAILVAQAPADQERAACRPQQRRVPPACGVGLSCGWKVGRDSLISRITECLRILNPIFVLEMDLRRPPRG